MAAQLNAAAGEEVHVGEHQQVQEENEEAATKVESLPEHPKEEHRSAPRLSS